MTAAAMPMRARMAKPPPADGTASADLSQAYTIKTLAPQHEILAFGIPVGYLVLFLWMAAEQRALSLLRGDPSQTRRCVGAVDDAARRDAHQVHDLAEGEVGTRPVPGVENRALPLESRECRIRMAIGH